ncbi:MAG: hypothetical protein ABL997_12845 [Planctomycetota bacterium]
MRRLLPFRSLTSLTLLTASACLAQATDDRNELRKTFRSLSPEQQQAVLADVDKRLAALGDPAVSRLEAAAQPANGASALRARTFHDQKIYAPEAATRILIGAGDPRHARVRSDFAPVRILRDLRARVVYDWLAGEPALAPVPPDLEERFANLCAGYPPVADAAIASVLVQLDRDFDQRVMAEWCEQLYADRDGRVFEGISLYTAWYSGRVVEVPDVDAIAFAQRIVQTDSFQSPIPEGRRRDRLYGQIRAAIKKHREYRTLCETAAAAFVTVSPELEETYQPLVDRMHLLWGECGQDVARFAEKLTASDRSELLAELDARVTKSPEAYSLALESKNEKKALADLVKQTCRDALAAAASNATGTATGTETGK